jgi:hypothetical protein
MNRTEYLNTFTIRQLRIYGRRQGMTILQKWGKAELVAAIAMAGK